MKAAEITIDYESNQPMTGLLLALSTSGTTDTTDCVISEKSPIFSHIYDIYDALNVLFLQLPKSHFLREMYHMNQSSINQTLTFGLQNFSGMCIGIPNMEEINRGLLKAALSGGIRRGDILKGIEYQNGNERVSLYLQISNTESRDASDLVQRANELFQDQENFPVKLHLQHTVQPNKKGDFSEEMISVGETELDLSSNSFVRNIQLCSSLRYTNWTRLGTGLIQYHAREIDLCNNNIGRDGCAILADLLKEEGSPLKCLKLKQNQIDDECLSLLVDGLRNNSTLRTLDIGGNNRITSTGWKYLFDLVCNNTDINSTYQSNHTIETFGADPPRDLSRDLRHVLWLNEHSASVADKKIWYAHFKDKVPFDLGPFLDMDVEIMPFVLAWFAANHEAGVISGWDEMHGIQAFYHFIRNHWDIAKMESRTAELEKLVDMLKTENKELREENQLLKGSKEGSVDMDSQKRQRKS